MIFHNQVVQVTNKSLNNIDIAGVSVTIIHNSIIIIVFDKSSEFTHTNAKLI